MLSISPYFGGRGQAYPNGGSATAARGSPTENGVAVVGRSITFLDLLCHEWAESGDQAVQWTSTIRIS